MINPQVSMPVLYHPHADDHLGDQPLAATIARVWSPTMINISIVDANGLVQNRTSVPLYQGLGNAHEVAGSLGRFCEFPEWFVKLMAWPAYFTPPFIATAAAPCVPSAHFECHLAYAAPAGTQDLVRCELGGALVSAVCASAERPDTQPTSQVLG